MKKREIKLSEIIGDFNIVEMKNMFEEIKKIQEIRKKHDKRTIEETKEEVRKLLRNMEQDKKIGGNNY